MKSFLPDKLYDVLSWIALVALDAVGLLYKALASAWHLPYADEIVVTCMAVSTFIGTLIGVSKIQYKNSVNTDIQQIGEEVREELKDGTDEDEQ